MRGKVLLALATLLSTAGHAAARYGMPDPLTDRGRIVESGSHQRLIEQNGLYATSWSRQNQCNPWLNQQITV